MGKIKERFYKEAINEYKKRIENFVKIEIIETNKIDSKCDYNIYLDERGKELTSLEFANFLKDLLLQYKKIGFYIGGWEGLKEYKDADFILSLSKMTFPYQLCRVILLEQIYRALAIIKGISYHK